jgi:ABC-type Zn2+ transport system substrate-binding protein/surface adhesin
MRFLTRLLLALCVLAGMANGMVHMGAHDVHDECAAHHSHDHEGSHHSHEDDSDNGGKDAHHHHDCCHFPNADCSKDVVFTSISFQPILVEISTDVALAPEEPVFALDKPPLI